VLPGALTRRGTKTLASLRTCDGGQGLFEYVLIIALLAIVVGAGLHTFGGRANNALASASDQLSPTAPIIGAENPPALVLHGYSRDGSPTERFVAPVLEAGQSICRVQWIGTVLQCSSAPRSIAHAAQPGS